MLNISKVRCHPLVVHWWQTSPEKRHSGLLCHADRTSLNRVYLNVSLSVVCSLDRLLRYPRYEYECKSDCTVFLIDTEAHCDNTLQQF